MGLCPRPRGLSLCGQNAVGTLGKAEGYRASRPPPASRHRRERSGCSSAEPYPLRRHPLLSDRSFQRQSISIAFLPSAVPARVIHGPGQLAVDLQILLDQARAAVQRVGRLGGSHPLRSTVTDPIKLTEVAVHRFHGMVRLAGDLVRRLALSVPLPTDDPLDRNGPLRREVEPPSNGHVIAIPHLGGLHHRYTRAA